MWHILRNKINTRFTWDPVGEDGSSSSAVRVAGGMVGGGGGRGSSIACLRA